MRPAVFLPDAEAEFEEAARFYESQTAGLGADFIAEVERTTEEVSRRQEIGVPHFEDTRRVLVPRFPFGVVYQNQEEQILIVAVAHQRRRPGYWRNR